MRKECCSLRVDRVTVPLFGAKRIPEFAKGLGKVIEEFRGGASDIYEIENEKQ